MESLDLEPHEELDEIDLRTNDDGSVDVKLLGWEKTRSNRVDVKYRTPTGSVKTENMRWPQSNDTEYKFIRLIELTPYTLRTAEQINEDDDLWVTAWPERWDLVLEKESSWKERFHDIDNPRLEVLKFLFYPIALICIAANVMEADMAISPVGGTIYDEIWIDDEKHLAKHFSALKSALYLLIWVIVIIALI